LLPVPVRKIGLLSCWRGAGKGRWSGFGRPPKLLHVSRLLSGRIASDGRPSELLLESLLLLPLDLVLDDLIRRSLGRLDKCELDTDQSRQGQHAKNPKAL
jgi:hypothetical protein